MIFTGNESQESEIKFVTCQNFNKSNKTKLLLEFLIFVRCQEFN